MCTQSHCKSPIQSMHFKDCHTQVIIWYLPTAWSNLKITEFALTFGTAVFVRSTRGSIPWPSATFEWSTFLFRAKTLSVINRKNTKINENLFKIQIYELLRIVMMTDWNTDTLFPTFFILCAFFPILAFSRWTLTISSRIKTC